jgi:hypothetical protein
VTHIIRDTVFLIIENIGYAMGYKASHLQTEADANHVTDSHIIYNLDFYSLILFSVITLNFTKNFLTCTELQS